MTNSNYLAIDIGGSAIKWAILDTEGTIHKKDRFKVDKNDYEAFYQEISKLVSESGCKKVGISSPGTIDMHTKTISGTVAVPCIKAGPWVTRLESELGVQCSIENDANCSTLAEMWIGNARGYKNLLNIVIGTGIGSTLVINNQIVRGANLYGAELGYLVHIVDRRYVYESELTSTKALVDRVNRIIPVESGLDVFANIKNEQVYDEYKSYIKDLAVLFYNAVHMYDPEVVLVGGAIAENNMVIEDLKIEYENIRQVVGMSSIRLNLNTCKFHNDSNLIGAVYNYISENEAKSRG